MSFATARKRGLMFKQKIVWPRPNLSARESLCLTLLLLLSCSPQFAHGTRAQASSYQPTPVQSTGQQPTRPNIAAQSKAVTVLVPDQHDDSLDEARRLHAQARREYLASKYTEAIQTEQKSLGIRQKFLGPDHPDVASSLFNLGLYYRNAGDIPEAEESYLKSLAIREKA